MKQLFIAWVPFQRRSLSMKSYFRYELEFLSFSFKSRLLRPLEYIFKSWKTLVLFLQHKPELIWVQLPPTPLLHLAFLYKLFLNRKVKIVADCHNATFRSPWINFPGVVKLLNRCDSILIHNDSVKKQALTCGITPQYLSVLEDPPAEVENGIEKYQEIFFHPWILCPCSFNNDEPINTIFEAANLTPEITFVLTGKVERAKGVYDLSNIPRNVKLPGFIPKEEFDKFLFNADVILGLTKLEGIQLSVANEAVGVGKAMVLANTKVLTKLFYKGAIYVDAFDANSIAEGCREALQKKEELSEAVRELMLERKQIWLNQASILDTCLRNC